MASPGTQNLQNLLSQLQQELEMRQNSMACPHCGASLTLVGVSATASKSPRKLARRAPKAKAVQRGKRKPGSRKRGGAHTSELVSLAIQYAKTKHNGRIGDAYRDVKKGIAKQRRGKRPEEVKALKTEWFRQQLANS